ncbi:MAG: MazG nucleotide pyrophosphohydrolase domain-containing protein [Patescibacteria group bacterium]|jgi:NTP pyrophosphatase (non-canonical NTP hydrolase)
MKIEVKSVAISSEWNLSIQLQKIHEEHQEFTKALREYIRFGKPIMKAAEELADLMIACATMAELMRIPFEQVMRQVETKNETRGYYDNNQN